MFKRASCMAGVLLLVVTVPFVAGWGEVGCDPPPVVETSAPGVAGPVQVELGSKAKDVAKADGVKKASAQASARSQKVAALKRHLDRRLRTRPLARCTEQMAKLLAVYPVDVDQLCRVAILESGGGAHCCEGANPFGWLDGRHYGSLEDACEKIIPRMYARDGRSLSESYAYL